jgi:hypothetical protein
MRPCPPFSDSKCWNPGFTQEPPLSLCTGPLAPHVFKLISAYDIDQFICFAWLVKFTTSTQSNMLRDSANGVPTHSVLVPVLPSTLWDFPLGYPVFFALAVYCLHGLPA